MNWKEQAKSQFADRRTPETLIPIVVPEWNTTIYYWPDMTLAERIELLNNYDPEVIAKIVSAMNDTPQSVEDAEKK